MRGPRGASSTSVGDQGGHSATVAAILTQDFWTNWFSHDFLDSRLTLSCHLYWRAQAEMLRSAVVFSIQWPHLSSCLIRYPVQCAYTLPHKFHHSVATPVELPYKVPWKNPDLQKLLGTRPSYDISYYQYSIQNHFMKIQFKRIFNSNQMLRSNSINYSSWLNSLWFNWKDYSI